MSIQKREEMTKTKERRIRVAKYFLCMAVLLVCILLPKDEVRAETVSVDYPLYSYEVDYNGNAIIISYTGEEDSVAIPAKLDGHKVVSIGESAFAYNTKLEEVRIPTYVKDIQKNAFYNCKNLTRVFLQDGIKKIGEAAFYNCYKLEVMDLPEGLESIGSYGLASTALTIVKLPSTMTTLGLDAFNQCDKLQSVTISSDITSSPKSTKWKSTGRIIFGCSNLMTVHFTNDVTLVPRNLMYNCGKVTSIYFPDTITTIGKGAMEHCSGITKLEFPDSLVTIEEAAFRGCDNLAQIKWGASIKEIGTSAFYGNRMTEVMIPDSVEKVGSYAFGYSPMETVTIGKGVKELGTNIVSGCTFIREVHVKAGNPHLQEEGGVIYADNGATVVMDCKTHSSITVKDGAKVILSEAFEWSKNLQSISFPGSIEEVGENAFIDTPFVENSSNYINGVLEVGKCIAETIPENVPENYSVRDGIETICRYAFYDCQNLKTITFPNSLKTICPGAFSSCENLETIHFGNGLKEIQTSAFNRNYALTKITIPNSVETIGDYAFDQCWELSEVHLGSGLRNLGYDVFSGTSIPFEGNMQYVDGWLVFARHGATAIYNNFVVKDGTIGLANSLLLDQPYAAKITLPSSLKYIGDYAFCGVDYLKEVVIPDGVEIIGYGAFGECPKLEKVTIGKSVKVVSGEAFSFDSVLSEVKFTGSAPKFGKALDGTDKIFGNVAAKVYYPAGDSTWTEDVIRHYGGVLTWEAFGAVPTPTPEPDNDNNPFADVATTGWQYSFAKYAYEKGLMNGKGTNEAGKILFAPADNLTRAELVQILYSMEGKPAVNFTYTFTDVKATDWFRYAVLWANANGVASGTGGGKFEPNRNISREQVATMLKKYAEIKGYDVSATTDLSGFEDVDEVSSWASGNISWAVANGIISGKAQNDGTKLLDPKGNASRAECAAMLKKFREKFMGQ